MEHIFADIALQFCSRSAIERVVALAARHGVAVASAIQQIIAAAPLQDVGSGMWQ